MSERMKVALIGAGAIGAYFIWGFDGVCDIDFTVVADKERLDRLKTNGVRINGSVYRPNFATPCECGVQDLILITTKYSGLDSAIEMLPAMVGENTLVMSLLNGVDSEEKVIAKIGGEHVVHSLMRIASQRTDEGIVFNPDNTAGAFFGGVTLSDPENELKKVAAIFDMAGGKIRYTCEDDIVTDIWIKYASNVANNLPQAILTAPAAMYTESEHGYFLAKKLWEEVRAVGLKKGIEVGKEVSIYTSALRSSRYSTLQDIDAGRHTEVDMFAGQMIKMAAEYGIEVPYCEYTYHALKVLEEKNDGKFD